MTVGRAIHQGNQAPRCPALVPRLDRIRQRGNQVGWRWRRSAGNERGGRQGNAQLPVWLVARLEYGGQRGSLVVRPSTQIAREAIGITDIERRRRRRGAVVCLGVRQQ